MSKEEVGGKLISFSDEKPEDLLSSASLLEEGEEVGTGWVEVGAEPLAFEQTESEKRREEYRRLQKVGSKTEWRELNESQKETLKDEDRFVRMYVAVMNQALMSGESVPGEGCKNAKHWTKEEIQRRYEQMQGKNKEGCCIS